MHACMHGGWVDGQLACLPNHSGRPASHLHHLPVLAFLMSAFCPGCTGAAVPARFWNKYCSAGSLPSPEPGVLGLPSLSLRTRPLVVPMLMGVLGGIGAPAARSSRHAFVRWMLTGPSSLLAFLVRHHKACWGRRLQTEGICESPNQHHSSLRQCRLRWLGVCSSLPGRQQQYHQ